jgi:hypothetical protein
MTFCTFRYLTRLGAGKAGLVSQLRRGWGLSYEPREWQAAVKRMSDRLGSISCRSMTSFFWNTEKSFHTAGENANSQISLSHGFIACRELFCRAAVCPECRAGP